MAWARQSGHRSPVYKKFWTTVAFPGLVGVEVDVRCEERDGARNFRPKIICLFHSLTAEFN